MVTSYGWHDGPVGESEKPQNWTALARAVTDRRVELGHRTLRAFAEASGLSTKTLGEIEGAKRSSYDRATLIQIEQALRWPAGRARAILVESPVEAALLESLAAHGRVQPSFTLDPATAVTVTPTDQALRLSWLVATLPADAAHRLEAAVEAVMDMVVPHPPVRPQQAKWDREPSGAERA